MDVRRSQVNEFLGRHNAVWGAGTSDASNEGHSDKYLANKARVENMFGNGGVEGIKITDIMSAINQGMSAKAISLGLENGLLKDGYTIKNGVWGKYESKSMLIDNGDKHNAMIGTDKDTYFNDDWTQTSMVPSTMDEYAFGEFFVPLDYTDLFAGALQPVAYSIELNFSTSSGFAGSFSPYGVLYSTQGSDKGSVYGYSTGSIGGGRKLSMSAGIVYTQYIYVGNINHFNAKELVNGWSYSISGSASSGILGGGLSLSITPNSNYPGEILFGISGGFYLGFKELPPINYSGMVNNTHIWKKK